MSKVKLLLVTLAAIFLAQSAMAQSQEPNTNEIANLTVQLIKNNPQFSNPDLVYPGDTVRVVENGKVTIYTVGKWARDSKDGCLWQIAKKHLQKKSQTTKSDEPTKKVVALNTAPEESLTVVRLDYETTTSQKIPTPEKANKKSFNWQLFLNAMILPLVISIFLAVIYLIYIIKKHWAENSMEKQNPVIPEGLPLDPLKAMNLLYKSYPNLREKDKVDMVPIKMVSRGHLQWYSGPKSIKVLMSFSDGFHASALKDQEPVHCITFDDGTAFYYKSSCGNMYVVAGEGSFHFPEGWGYIPEISVEKEEQQTQTAQEKAQ